MADSVDYGEHNLASLDLNAVNEGTAVELLRKRYTHGEIYVSIFGLFQLPFYFYGRVV